MRYLKTRDILGVFFGLFIIGVAANVSADEVEANVFYKGRGCKNCGGSGYSGRVPIFEFLRIDNEMREIMLDGSSESRLREAARRKGYAGLFEDGVSKVLAGITTAEEVLRVTYSE